MDDYDLASIALCAFEGVTQPRITRTKWKDGVDLEVATPGLRRFADAVVERELFAIREALTGEDYASLPSDIPTVRMAHEIRSDRDKFLQQVRDTCSRAEKAERELSAKTAEAERLREALRMVLDDYTSAGVRLAQNHYIHAALDATRKEEGNG